MSQSGKHSKGYKVPDKKQMPSRTAAVKHPWANLLEEKPWIYVILLFAIVSILYFPTAFQKMYPPASDTIQWQGAAHTIIEYNKTHSDKALWQPNMFGGMPSYLISLPNAYPFVENVTKLVDFVMNWRIFLLFIGGLGVFILLRFMGMDAFTSFFGAIAFVFSSHWTGLLDIGHNTKYRAIMWIPWVVWGIMYLKEKRNLLGIGLSSAFLIAQLRENHPQISYYLYIFIGMYWVYCLIENFKSKEWSGFAAFTVMLAASFVFMALAVMNPYLSTWEYGHYTIRGGETGLDKAYAQGWSFHPLEIITFVIPDFFGGINQTYWGWMEFTQIYNYMGILVLALAIFALGGKRKRLAWFLWISSAIFLVMSFGRHFNALSDLLLRYLPYFNKFRVPSMLLTIPQFLFAVLAALGLSAIIEKYKADDKAYTKKVQTWLIVIAVLFVLFLAAGKGIFKGLPFTTEGEMAQLRQNNALSQLPQIKEMRLNMLWKSGALSLLFLTLGMGSILLFLRRNMVKTVFLILILLLVFVDLWIYTGKSLKSIEPARFRDDNFAKRDFDEYLHSDTDTYRIFPINNNMTGMQRMAAYWAFHHQTIQGYHGAKLKRYQEILENCIDAELRQQRINWNVINMLNTKYIVFSDTLPFMNLQPVFTSNQAEVVVHKNWTALPRAWFVDSLQVMTEPKAIWEQLNSDAFNPAATAIVEEEIAGTEKPEVKNASLTAFGMHNISFEVETDRQSFLTVSEVYYPAGWKAYIDGKETEIYPVNYILRGVVVPAGKHTLEMKFEPQSYKLSLVLSLIGLLVSALSLVGGLLLWFRKRKGKAIPAPANN
jgi:hypothetical protein